MAGVTPDGWRAALDCRLREHLTRSYARAPAVRALLDGAALDPGAVRGLADLEALPVVTKDDLVRLQAEDPPFGGFCAVPLEQLTRVYVSPGPLYEPDGAADGDRNPYDWLLPLLEAHEVPRSGRALVTFSYHLVPAGLGFDEAIRRYGLTAIPGGVGQTDVQAQAVLDLGVVLYGGTPSFLLSLLERVEALAGGGDDLRLRYAVVGAEAYTTPLRAEFTRRGITVIETYGTADVGLLGATCPERVGFHLSGEAAVEIVDPASGRSLPAGDVGEVVVTTLNPVYPLVRFGTGDLAALQPEPCRCGCPSPVLSRLAGRVGQAVKVRGMFLHPHQVDAAMRDVGGVGRYQAAVRRSGHRDELILRVEVPAGDGDTAERLQHRVRELWRVRPDRVETVPVGTLPEGGKVLVDERPWDG